MANNLKHTANRTTLVDGCGTILKTNRLSGGYKLVKRKRVAGAKATTPAKRRGRPAKVKMVASVTAPAKRRGRPAKAKMVAPVKRTAKRRGRRVSAKA